MIRAQSCDVGQCRQRDVVRKMFLDVLRHFLLLPAGQAAANRPLGEAGTVVETQKLVHEHDAQRLYVLLLPRSARSHMISRWHGALKPAWNGSRRTTSTVSVRIPFHAAMRRRAISEGANCTTGSRMGVETAADSLMTGTPDLRDPVTSLSGVSSRS